MKVHQSHYRKFIQKLIRKRMSIDMLLSTKMDGSSRRVLKENIVV